MIGEVPQLLAAFLPADPAKWIAEYQRPTWDEYFMSQVFSVAMRSPDQETKVGSKIVDWQTKSQMGGGYNGHPSGSVSYGSEWTRCDLPITRPDKYFCMTHSEANAAAQCQGMSDDAVVYTIIPPCEVCLSTLNQLRLRRINVRRICYLEYRHYPETERLLRHLPHISMTQYEGQHPSKVLLEAAMYAAITTTFGETLSKGSTKSYANLSANKDRKSS
jgi:deoxycytidylate deaminase